VLPLTRRRSGRFSPVTASPASAPG